MSVEVAKYLSLLATLLSLVVTVIVMYRLVPKVPFVVPNDDISPHVRQPTVNRPERLKHGNAVP